MTVQLFSTTYIPNLFLYEYTQRTLDLRQCVYNLISNFPSCHRSSYSISCGFLLLTMFKNIGKNG